METRIKELIAVGASVTANCQPCLQHHLKKAQESGAQEEEIREAIATAKMVRRGAQAKMDQFAATLLKVAEAPLTEAARPCGCN